MTLDEMHSLQTLTPDTVESAPELPGMFSLLIGCPTPF